MKNKTGASIRHTRTGLGLTMRAVAAKAGISAAYLCDIELGNRNVPVNTMEKIRRAMGPKARVVESHCACPKCHGTGVSAIPLMLVAD